MGIINKILFLKDFLFLYFTYKKGKKACFKVLNPSFNLFPKALNEVEKKKIFDTYGILIPGILGNAFAQLTGEKLSENEHKILCYLAALTPIIDDYFDNPLLDKNIPKERFQQLEVDEKADDREKLMMHLYRKMVALAHDKETQKLYIAKVIEAQELSLKQLNKNIIPDDLIKIAYRKGGYSLLLCRSALNTHIAEGEPEAIYHLGGFIQLLNDLMDVYKDREDGVYTIVTKSTDISSLKQFLNNEWNHVIHNFYGIGYKTKNTKKFLFKLAMLVGISKVMLELLEDLQNRTDGVFKLDEYTRKDLVCDMDNFKNVLKSIRFALNEVEKI